jgi:hypothetical protein
MTPSLPARILPPARVDLSSERNARAPARDSADDPPSTMHVDENADRSGRRFAFRAARQQERPTERPSESEVRPGQALVIDEERRPSAAMFDRPNSRSSTCFLAGAIAQARPGVVLHNPPYREAAGAYRRSDALGPRDPLPRVRSDTQV